MRRYYEERDKGEAPATAMTTAITKVGRAITASGIATMGGFAALLAATDFLILRDFGIMTVIAISLSLVSALVVHPPLVVWVDSWLERRRPVSVLDTSEETVPD
jgi:predicted RND superfamily exporter protein